MKDDGEDIAALERARADLIDAIGLAALPSQGSPDLGSIKSKSAPTYLTATGRVPGKATEVAASIAGALSGAGFRPVAAAQARPNVVAGLRDDMVAEIAVYEELGSLRDDPASAYVQLQLGRRDSALAWTQVRAG
jgi:hypothetical protein